MKNLFKPLKDVKSIGRLILFIGNIGDLADFELKGFVLNASLPQLFGFL